MENKQNYLQIEYSVLELLNYNGVKLNLIDKLIYSYFVSWSKTTNKIYPSLSKLSKIFGVSVSTVQRSLDVLLKSNMVAVSKENENKNSKTYYHVLKLNTQNKTSHLISLDDDLEENIPF